MKENPEGLTRGSVLVVSRGDEGFRQLRDVLERGSQAVHEVHKVHCTFP